MDLYQQGQLMHAHEAAARIAPLRAWRGAAARVAAGRLAMNIGAPRLGRVLHMLAYREDPRWPEAIYYRARALYERRGPLPAWEFMQSVGRLDDAWPDIRADWLSFHAQVLGIFRDFETAEHWLDEADGVAPDNPWSCIERADLLERQDRYGEALAAARRSLEIRPFYRPGVQSTANLLQLLDRDHEALDLLRAADQHIQSGPVVMMLAALETDLELYDDARRSWERAAALSPLMEKGMGHWMAGRRSDAAYYCGDFASAADLAEQSKSPFHEQVAVRLRETAGVGRRMTLPVPFVRQHHMTCAPATLSALSRFWSMPADHLDVAEAICYDGTPAHSERAWAERNGYVAREFTVNWHSSVALLDRGVPFTFTTVEATSAHLQAVIGYDSLRGTLLIRDPFMRQFGEFLAEKTFERFRSSGPRGMILVPADRALLLDGIELPDVLFYDLLHELQQALAAHDRVGAQAAYEAMRKASPEHRLTLSAQRSLASYDADLPGSLAAIDALLALYPDDNNLKLSRIGHLRHVARRDERLAYLQSVTEAKGVDPIFWQQLAQELADDAREAPRAVRLLRRALRYRRADTSILHSLASLLWEQGKREKATQLYRLAACIGDKDEGLARSYFVAARHMKLLDHALRMLTDRFERFGKRSSSPARSLFWAYDTLNQDASGFEVIQRAIALRPDDGSFKLYASNAHARHGRFAVAEQLLADAQGHCAPTEWLRGSADIATIKGESRQALELWRQVVEREPLSADAHAYVARLLAETQSPAAALEYLEKTADRFPKNYRLTQLWIEWLRDEGPVRAEPVIRRLIRIHPVDGWARRELASTLVNLGQLEEALAEADAALAMDPSNPSSPFHRGMVLARLGRLEEARAAHRAAIALSVDADFAIAQLLQCCESGAQKIESLAFVHEQIVRQTIFGDALLAYRRHARQLLDGIQTLGALRKALEARPDLWHAWSAVAEQLLDLEQFDEAVALCTAAAAQFPLLPRAWVDLAAAYGAAGKLDARIESLQSALELSPGWSRAGRELGEAYERKGDLPRARELLEQCLRRAPLDVAVMGSLADVLWKLDSREEALARVEQAVKVDPDYRWAWDRLAAWSTELKRPHVAVDIARELTRGRSGESRSWLVLARTLTGADTVDERLAAAHSAIELNPRSLDAHDLNARLLAEVGRFDEALAACRPAIFGSTVHARLAAREAWVTERRGDAPRAIELMTRVVKDDPAFYWAWMCLADWRRAGEDHPAYLEAAQSLVRLYPRDPVSLGYLGEALIRANERDAAKGVLRKAIEISPDYDFGANLLFDTALEDKELDLADLAASVLRVHHSGNATTCRAGCIAAARGNVPAAMAALKALCASESPAEQSIDRLVREMERWNQADAAQPVLTDSFGSEEPRPGVAKTLMEMVVRQKRWSQAAQIASEALGRPKLAMEAVGAFIDAVAAGNDVATLRQFVKTHRQALRADTWLWGKVSYGLLATSGYRAVVDWTSDWQSRTGVEPWVLTNRSDGLRAIGRFAQAHAVNAHAITLPGADAVFAPHLLWLAVDAALAGDMATAGNFLADPRSHRDASRYRFVRALAEQLIGAQGQSFAETRGGFARARALFPKFHNDPPMRRLYYKCIARSVATGPGILLRAWALGHWINQPTGKKVTR